MWRDDGNRAEISPARLKVLLHWVRHADTAHDQEHAGENAADQIAKNDLIFLGMLKFCKCIVDGIRPQTEGEDALQRPSFGERVYQNNDPAHKRDQRTQASQSKKQHSLLLNFYSACRPWTAYTAIRTAPNAMKP